MPMWFARDADGSIRCTTFGKSQKVLNWRRDPRTTLLVESGVEHADLNGVVIYATCEIIENIDAVKDTLVAINSRCRDLDDAAIAKLGEAVSGTAAKRVVLTFTPVRYVPWDHAKLGDRY